MLGTEPDLKEFGVFGGALLLSIDIPPRPCLEGLPFIGFKTQGSGDGVPALAGAKSRWCTRGLNPRGGALHGFADKAVSSVALRDVMEELAVCRVELELFAEIGLVRE